MKKIFFTLFLVFLINQNVFANELWNIQNGLELIKNQKFNDAASFFEGYIKSSPNSSDGHYYLGLCYKNLGQMEKSAYHLQKSYELSKNLEKIKINYQNQDKNTPESDYLDMANMYLEDGNLLKALQYADLIENLNPDNIDSLLLKTKIYDLKGDLSLAKIYFKKALMLDSTLLNSIYAKKLNINSLPDYDFDYYNTKGLEYYYSANAGAAKDYFNKALAIEPKNPVVYNNLALCYMKLNNFNKAREMLNKALSADKNFNLTYINLAKLEAVQDKMNKKTGANKQIEKYLQKAIKTNPNSKFAYLELGNYYFENKNFKEAAENFQNAILIDDNFFEAYMGLGRCHIENGNFQEGIKILRKASFINKDSAKNPDILYYLAKICIANGNFDEAKGYLLDAINENENADFYFELGKIYYNKDDLSSAKNALNKAMELDLSFKHEADIYNYLGLIEYKNFDTQKAIYMFKKAIELNPNRAMYLYNLAQAHKSLGDKNAYSKEINAIAGLAPKTVQDYLDFSTIYFDKKNVSAAIKILNDGISKFPDEMALYQAKLRLFKTLQDKEGIQSTEAQIKAKFKK